MACLTVALLGPLHVLLDDRAAPVFAYDKVRGLFAYLVVEADRPHRREALAELFWPDQPASTARHSLSQALSMLRRAIEDRAAMPPYLLVGRDAIQFNLASDHRVDVAQFNTLFDTCSRHPHARREHCGECAEQLERAVRLFRGDFLEQFSIGDSAAFEEWVMLQRGWLRGRALDALAWLGDVYEQRGAYDRLIVATQRQIALDPWLEPVHRRLMWAFARNGQRPAALRHYEQLRRQLGDELGIEPDDESTALYDHIRTGRVASSADARQPARLPPGEPARRPSLPPTTPLVGREHDVTAIRALLADASNRLVSLVGPGGIGKTSLVVQVARLEADAFADGVCFVPLAPLRAARQIVPAVAEALDLQFFGQGDPLSQLQGHVRSKHMLLVFDNMEHVLDGAPIISALLQSAPAITMLVTSRERLNLHGEWVYEVEGLRVPEGDAVDAIEEYAAVQLFVQSARRVGSRFAMDGDERRCVARICRLAGGMPLAIELAAAWVTVLPCAEIAHEIEQNLDFLTSSARDLPERHQSMRAVFDHSWRLLGERERGIFRRLSVFECGMTRAAATEVADAALPGLAALVAKSLLRRSATDRYEIHELLRQYGFDQLQLMPDEQRMTRTRHAAFYAGFLERCASRLRGRDQQAAIRDFLVEMENIRAAWQWASEHDDLALLAQSFDGLWLFFASHGNVSEAGALLEQAIARLEDANTRSSERRDERERLLGELRAGLAPMLYRIGQFERARSLLEQSIPDLRRLGADRVLAFALHHLAATYHLQGAYAEERAALRESIAWSEAADDRWLIGYSLNDLGLCTLLLDDVAEARRLCGDGLALFRAIDDRRGIAFALNNLGVIAAGEGRRDEAERLHRDSLAIRREIDDRWGTAMSLAQLGIVARSAGQPAVARVHLLDALQTAFDIRALPIALDMLVELAQLILAEGDLEQARGLLAVAANHPALTPESARHIVQLRDQAPMLAEVEPLTPDAQRVDQLIGGLLSARQRGFLLA